MSDFVQGQVQAVSKSQKGFYSLRVNDDWYGYAMKNPGVDKGQEVAFSFTSKGDFKIIDGDSFEITKKEAAPVSGGSGNSRDGYWEKKAEVDKVQQRIREHHAARGTAVDLVKVLVENGAVKLPSTENKRYDAVLALTDELTERFYQDIGERFYNNGEVELLEDAKAEED